jgi:hypothetical protein
MREENYNTDPKKEQATVSGMLREFDKVSYFRLETIIKNIPFFLFIVLLAVFYIWNNNRGVAMVKEYRDTEQEMLELEWYYNSAKDNLTRESRQSAVAEMVDTLHMQELSNPPYTI